MEIVDGLDGKGIVFSVSMSGVFCYFPSWLVFGMIIYFNNFDKYVTQSHYALLFTYLIEKGCPTTSYMPICYLCVFFSNRGISVFWRAFTLDSKCFWGIIFLFILDITKHPMRFSTILSCTDFIILELAFRSKIWLKYIFSRKGYISLFASLCFVVVLFMELHLSPHHLGRDCPFSI